MRTELRVVVLGVLAAGACAKSVGPPTKSDIVCDQDSDCVAWPSECCQWKAVNRRYRGPPGPNAGCEMECPRTPVGAACRERVCLLRWADAPPPEPKHPSR